MLRKIRNLIKKAIITLILEDTANVQKSQVQFYDNVRDVEIISPYGIYGVAPLGSQVVLFQVNGQEENLVGIADDVNNRPKNLKEGELILKNIKTNTAIYFKQDGSLEVTTNGNLNITVDGDADITADNVDVNALQVDINASVTNLGVGGNAIARVGDFVDFNSSSPTYTQIITGGTNTSI